MQHLETVFTLGQLAGCEYSTLYKYYKIYINFVNSFWFFSSF